MNKPIFEIVLVRRDGNDQTFIDHKNNIVSKKYRRVGCIFPRRDGKPGGSLVFDKEFNPKELASGDFFINVDQTYEAKQAAANDGVGVPPPPRASGGRRRAAPTPPPSDDDDDIPF